MLWFKLASTTATETWATDHFWDLLFWVSWEPNIAICLHMNNSHIDISPMFSLVAKSFTLGRFCCAHNKAFWSTKHLLPFSEFRNCLCLTPALYDFQVRQGLAWHTSSRPAFSPLENDYASTLAQQIILFYSITSKHDTVPSYR